MAEHSELIFKITPEQEAAFETAKIKFADRLIQHDSITKEGEYTHYHFVDGGELAPRIMASVLDHIGVPEVKMYFHRNDGYESFMLRDPEGSGKIIEKSIESYQRQDKQMLILIRRWWSQLFPDITRGYLESVKLKTYTVDDVTFDTSPLSEHGYYSGVLIPESMQDYIEDTFPGIEAIYLGCCSLDEEDFWVWQVPVDEETLFAVAYNAGAEESWHCTHFEAGVCETAAEAVIKANNILD